MTANERESDGGALRDQALPSPVTARSNCRWRTAVDSSVTFHAPFAPVDERCASQFIRTGGGGPEKKPRRRYPSGRLPPG
jgi:hypothetical protein